MYKSDSILIRLTKEEKKLLKELADKSGLTVSDYIREKSLISTKDKRKKVRS